MIICSKIVVTSYNVKYFFAVLFQTSLNCSKAIVRQMVASALRFGYRSPIISVVVKFQKLTTWCRFCFEQGGIICSSSTLRLSRLMQLLHS